MESLASGYLWGECEISCEPPHAHPLLSQTSAYVLLPSLSGFSETLGGNRDHSLRA